jgi:hypothetical protein
MSTPIEGLNAIMYLGTACPAGTADVIALLQGITLSYTQNKVPFYHMGSLNHYYVLDGVIRFDGGFTNAYTSNQWIGTLHLGTYELCGSLVPRGASSPAILGTVKLTSGSLSNMEAETAEAVMEDNAFIMYNLTFVG